MANQNKSRIQLVKEGFFRKHGKDVGLIIDDEKARNRYLSAIFLEMQRNGVIDSCTPESIFEVILNLADTGLNPVSHYQEVHIYPFKDQATMVVGYRGMIALAVNSGMVKDIHAEVVYDGDYFEHNLGTGQQIVHRKSTDHNLNAPLFVYAVARLNDDTWKVFVWTMAEAKAFKAKVARAKSLWHDPQNFLPMAKKQVIRMLLNLVPKRGETFTKAMYAEEQAEYAAETELKRDDNRAEAAAPDVTKGIQQKAKQLQLPSAKIKELFAKYENDAEAVEAELDDMIEVDAQINAEAEAAQVAENGSIQGK